MRDWLNEPIDLLKLDIEGAEFDVLKDCDDRLSIVKCLFVEYHSFASQRQRLPELFAMLRDAGFRVHVQKDYFRASPLLDPIIENAWTCGSISSDRGPIQRSQEKNNPGFRWGGTGS